MRTRNPVRQVFLFVGTVTMLLVIAAGFWSNWIYEQQYLQEHSAKTQENARLIASVLRRLPSEKRQQALLIVRDLIDTWDHNTNHRHRVVVQNSEGRDLLVFPYNIGVLEHSAEAAYPDGHVTLYTTAPSPVYPSQLYVLAALGVILIAVNGAGMLIADRALRQPLNSLAAAAERFATGDLEYRTSPSDHPVVGGVADTMNQMAEQLQSRINTILSQRQELEALFGSMVEGIIVLTRDGSIQRMNGAAAAFFGADPDRDIGKPLLQVIRSSTLNEIVQEVNNDGTACEREIQVYTPATRTLQLIASRYSSSFFTGVLVVLHDITEIRRLESVRRDFVANVSHELKTPITSISGFIETLIDDPELPLEQRQRFLQIIQNQSNRLRAIVEDLLSLSHIEEHGRELPHTTISIPQLLQNVTALCTDSAAEREIPVTVKHEAADTWQANANLLEQALSNLVQNAIKYSPSGSPVELHSFHPEQAPDHIRFEVVDNGSGIPQQDLPRLFERFYRVDRARSREMGGTGLGLAIVKHIALVHNGTADVRSTLGQGSTFGIELPGRV